MIDTQRFGSELKALGYDFYSGVPCSFLKDLINYAINECDYVMAANEGDALATCVGAQIAGRKSVVLMQNSGLGNAVSPLTSLNQVFKIPTLGFVSLRGQEGIPDEPQHQLMGLITDKMLETMRIEYRFLSDDYEEALKQLQEADSIINSGNSLFFIVRKGTFSKVSLNSDKKAPKKENLHTRGEMLEAVSSVADKESLYIATTGFTGRELYELGDKENNFYMVGSLGCTSSFALGVALAKPEKKVVVFDGDGAILMRMGNLAVNSAYKPANMLHILFDNNAHESTGGQFTVSGNVDYPKVASACGYQSVESVTDVDSLKKAVINAQERGGLTFIYVPISQGAPETLGRPKVTPPDVAKRFSALISRD
ncbi:phosphonopyruvate decarboxylase [bacterium]|nr:phosphonopyruvate decarboxylase [bacterium]